MNYTPITIEFKITGQWMLNSCRHVILPVPLQRLHDGEVNSPAKMNKPANLHRG